MVAFACLIQFGLLLVVICCYRINTSETLRNSISLLLPVEESDGIETVNERSIIDGSVLRKNNVTNTIRCRRTEGSNTTSTEPTSVQSAKVTCPPPGFDALQTFDIKSYVSAKWYVIRQKPLLYSSDETFCSFAQYTIDDSPNWVCKLLNLNWCKNALKINVLNRGLIGSVTGRENKARIKARQPDPKEEPAKIQVSFPIPGRTNYWIVAAGTYQQAIDKTYSIATGPTSNNYEWAIISGGSPNIVTSNNKCVAGRFGRFDVRGLWMFARTPIPPAGVIDGVSSIAEALGLDTAVWRPVTHEGCTNY